jgi:hypothetical protein
MDYPDNIHNWNHQDSMGTKLRMNQCRESKPFKDK